MGDRDWSSPCIGSCCRGLLAVIPQSPQCPEPCRCSAKSKINKSEVNKSEVSRGCIGVSIWCLPASVMGTVDHLEWIAERAYLRYVGRRGSNFLFHFLSWNILVCRHDNGHAIDHIDF